MANIEECSFDPCDKQAHSKGLCKGHYMQQYSGRPLTPLRQYNRAFDGFKKCPMCGVTKSVIEYYVRSTGERLSKCVTCERDYVHEARLEALATGAGATNKKDVGNVPTQITEESE